MPPPHTAEAEMLGVAPAASARQTRAMRNRPDNHLYYGDNLDVLRNRVADAGVDLVYLDPPFNSNAGYNVLFQQWVSWQVGGFPRDKKGGDKGIDGWFNYLTKKEKIETGVISVKAGDIVNPTMVRDLGRVMARDKFRFGLFIMKSLPTRGMREEAASHPTIETDFGRFPALQIVTLAELMHGHRPKLPPLISPVKKAARVETRASHQKGAQPSLL